MPSPKEQCEDLLNVVLPFAQKMLREHGEFYPFGATLKADGAIANVAGSSALQKPPSEELIRLIRDGFRLAASRKEIRATALAFDVRVGTPGGRDKTDAIAIELDHQDNYSVVVYFPYVRNGSSIKFGEAFASRGARTIFPGGG